MNEIEEYLKSINFKKRVDKIHCNAPFSAIRFHGDTIGICHNHHNQNDSVSNYNTFRIDKLANELITGELNDKCAYCAVRSKYSWINDITIQDNILKYKNNKPIDLKFLEIILGNNCNNNCKICDPIHCRELYTIENINNPIGEYELHGDAMDVIKDVGRTITHIEFIGGETFLYVDKMIEILDKCKNVSRLTIVTNGSIYSNKFVKYIEDNNIIVDMFISIDGTSDTNGYMRGWSNFHETIANTEKFQESKNIFCCINTAVSILNIMDLGRIVEQIHKNLSISISISLVRVPENYSIASIQDNNIRERMVKVIKTLDKDHLVNYDEVLNFAVNEKIKINNLKDFNSHTLSMINTHDEKIGMYAKDYLNKEILNYLTKT